jgi:hypothetical protein
VASARITGEAREYLRVSDDVSVYESRKHRWVTLPEGVRHDH